MSNNFPKVSPDGRWIVFVQCRNGQLMRPDSHLYIVPFSGGEARRLRANTPLMNSWHSFSPNGRWLVFSSKARSPYTQMYITHIDAKGNDSPAILIDNSTAANRAVNLPEFVNIAGDGIEDIQVPAVDVNKLMDEAMQFEGKNEFTQALEILKKAVTLEPDDARIQNDLAGNLIRTGDTEGAIEHLRDAIRINPLMVQSHFNLGIYLLHQGHPDQALPELETTVTLSPQSAPGEEVLADCYGALGNNSEALAHWRKALALEPKSLPALVGLARFLASSSDATYRNGAEAVTVAEQANDLTSGADPRVLDTLAAAYAEAGQFPQAITTANHALDLATATGAEAAANGIRYRISLYTEGKPYHVKGAVKGNQ
jgi:tetratricopeptide (TPR) repeat protein